MISKVIESAQNFLNQDNFSHESIILFIKSIREIVWIDNFHLLIVDEAGNYNVKKVNFNENSIVFPEIYFDASLIAKFYNMEEQDSENLSKYFLEPNNKTGKIAVIKFTHEELRYFAFVELQGTHYDFFTKYLSTFEFIFSSFVVKFFYNIPKNTTSFYSEINFPILIDEISNPIVIADAVSTIVIYGNKSSRALFGDDIQSKKTNEIIPFKSIIERLSVKDEENISNRFVMHHSLTNSYFEVTSQSFKLAGQREYTIYAFFDVTNTETAKSKLKEKSQYIDMQLKAFDLVALIDISDSLGNRLYSNRRSHDRSRNILNMPYHEMRQRNPQILVFEEEILENLKDGKITQKEIYIVGEDEEGAWFNSTVIPLYTEQGVRIISINQEITGFKNQQIEIVRLAQAIEYSPITIMITDKEGSIQFVNPTFTDVTGYKAEEVLGRNPRFLKSHQTPMRQYEELWDEISNGRAWKGNFLNKKKNGTLFWESAIISPIRDDKGDIVNYLGIKEDITEKLEMEKELTKSTTLLYTITETTGEGIVVFDLDGKRIMHNSRFLKLWNLRIEDIEQLNEEEILRLFESSVIDMMTYNDLLDTVLSDKNFNINTNIDLISNNVYEVSVMPFIQDEQTLGRMWTFRDITERVENEEKLRISNFQLERAKALSDEQAKKLEINVRELEEAKAKVEAAANAKTEFVANISHEIRTPLNAVIGFTEIMREEKTSPKQQEYLSSILSSGKNLLRLINDILDISKIDSGRLSLVNEPVNIQVFAKDIYQIFKSKIDSSHVKLIMKIDESIPEYLYLDEVRLRQILFNLIGNAIKFTSEGSIEYQFEKLSEDTANNAICMKLTVADTGIGISKDKQEQIFDAFYQVSGKNTKKYGGAGLGLAITKKLTEMIGGEITLQSEEGKGSVFEILFHKLKIYQPEGERTTSKANTSIDDNDKQFDANKIQFLPTTILAADDIPVNLTLLKGILMNQPIELLLASDGVEAVELFRNNKCNLVLMDYRMNDMNGDEAVRIIKNEINPDIKVILLSATSIEKDSIEDYDQLFDDTLEKPFKKDKLFEVLSKYLEYKHTEEETNESIPDYLSLQNTEISDEDIEKVQKYNYEIKANFCHEWQDIKNSRIINDVSNFAKKLKNFTKERNLPILYYYSTILADQAARFEIENMHKTIDIFPELLKRHGCDVDSEFLP